MSSRSSAQHHPPRPSVTPGLSGLVFLREVGESHIILSLVSVSQLNEESEERKKQTSQLSGEATASSKRLMEMERENKELMEEVSYCLCRANNACKNV